MKQEIIDSYNRLNSLNVSRETFLDFELFISMIRKKNKEINLISKETAKESEIRNRHIVDSAQIIDFIDFNQNTTTDLGSGGGLPGIVIAIILKNMKKEMKVHLYEKSYHKSNFLKEISKKFKLNTEINQKNIFEQKNLETDIIISRAFKPLPVIFEIASKNFKKYKYIILFLGKSGKEILKVASKKWKFDYEEKKSLTSSESLVVKISNLKKNG